MVKSLPNKAVALCVFVTSGVLFAPSVLADEALLHSSQDGEFRFQLKDYWLGQQAKLNYQVTPRLNLSWQYDEYSLDEFALDEFSDNQLAGYQYNARFLLSPEGAKKPAVYVSAHDFLADQDRRSYGIHAQKHLGDWQLALGYAQGDGLDGLQAHVRYSGFAPYVELDAVYHAQQDWHFQSLVSDLSGQHTLQQDAPQWHVGASWQPLKWAKLGVQYDGLGKIGVSASVLFDSKRAVSINTSFVQSEPTIKDIDRESLESIGITEQQTPAVMDALALVNVTVEAVAVKHGLIMLVISADDYAYWPDAIAQAQYVLNRILPTSIDAVEYIITQHDHALYSARESVVHIDGLAGNLAKTAISAQRMRLKPLSLGQVELANATRFRWLPDISARLDNAFFQPQDNALDTLDYYWGATLSADWSLGHGWQIETAVQADIAEDYFTNTGAQTVAENGTETIAVQEAHLMPLRTMHQQRHIDDDARLTKALVSKRGSAIKTQRNQYASYHYHVFAGQISSELHGLGGQVLYQMWQSRLAVGVNFAQLAVSDIQRLARLHVTNSRLHVINSTTASDTAREHTFTGTVNVYWATPWHNIDVSLEAGQFIGRDKGALVNIKRTFHNGWQFGLYAARTRLDGEYFTNSGLQLTIPLNGWLGHLPKNVQSALASQKVRYASGIHTLGNNVAYSLSDLTSDLWWQQRDARYDVFTQIKH